MKSWQLQEAKAHLSEVVREALNEGPQEITVRGEPAVVIIAKAEFEKLIHPKPSFVEFMQGSPLMGLKLDITRDTSFNREIDL